MRIRAEREGGPLRRSGRLAWLLALGLLATAAVAEPGLGEAEQRGKRIFTEGTAGSPLSARLVGADIEVDAAGFPCSNCHGPSGAGTQEGGMRAPDIRQAELQMPADALRGYGRDRPAYGPESLARAIRLGIDPANNVLHPGMPRFRIGDADMADLLAYMRVLGHEPVPGVSPTEIRIGMLSPDQGPLAEAGGLVRRVVSAFVDDLNRRGGIYGRELRLEHVRFDPAQPDSAERAVERVLAKQEFFCFTSELALRDEDPARALLAAAGVPVIGALGVPADPSPAAARDVFYLYSSFADQARVLVDYLALDLQRPGARAALVRVDDAFGRGAAAGFRAQSEKYDLELVFEYRYPARQFDARAAVPPSAPERPDAVFFFGSGPDLRAFVSLADASDWHPTLFASAASVGAAVVALAPEAAARVYLASPMANPDLQSKGMRDFLKLVEDGDIPGRHKAFQLASYAAASLLREGLRRAGQTLTRDRFLSELEALWKFDPGVLPELTFDANRRVGSAGANIVQLSPQARAFLQVADWREPR